MTKTRLDRDVIKSWVQQHIASLEAGDAASLMAGTQADINVIWPRAAWEGWDQVQASLAQQLSNVKTIRFYLRRLLIDVEQSVAGIEWVCRYIDQNTNTCYEFLGGAALDFTGDGELSHCQIYLDFDRSGVVSSLDAPWPQEQWSPGADPGPPLSRSQSEQFLRAYAAAWSNHDANRVGQLLHDEVYLCPPWAYREGKDEVEAIARYHFANFLDTQVTPRRIIFDETQPYFGVCQQTFACTNPKTGLRGQDTDFAFFEICKGKLRYWRNYFDTGRSIQDDYKEME